MFPAFAEDEKRALIGSDDENADDDEDEENWRKSRHEREQYLQEHRVSNPRALCNNMFVAMLKTFHLGVLTFVDCGRPAQINCGPLCNDFWRASILQHKR